MAKSDPLAKLIDQLAESVITSHRLMGEIRALQAGGPSEGDKVRQVMATWNAAWTARWGLNDHGAATHTYVWTAVRDVPAIKRLLKAMPIEELEARIGRYITSGDTYVVQARHPFQLFASTVNRYGAERAGMFELGAAPPDCKHTPRCRTDAEHTTKRREGLRDSAF